MDFQDKVVKEEQMDREERLVSAAHLELLEQMEKVDNVVMDFCFLYY